MTKHIKNIVKIDQLEGAILRLILNYSLETPFVLTYQLTWQVYFLYNNCFVSQVGELINCLI